MALRMPFEANACVELAQALIASRKLLEKRYHSRQHRQPIRIELVNRQRVDSQGGHKGKAERHPPTSRRPLATARGLEAPIAATSSVLRIFL